MQKEISELKQRLKLLENKLEQNRLEWNEERERNKEKIAAKVKEESLLKAELKQMNELLAQSKQRDEKLRVTK